MRTIILTVGIPGCGKSFWAKEEMAKHPGKYKRINKDLLREMLDWSGEFNQANEKFVLEVRDQLVDKALGKGKDVIIDDTNFNEKHWHAMCTIAKRLGDVRVYEKYFDVPLEVCLERNRNRDKKVPEDWIIKTFEKNVKDKHFQPKDEYFPIIPKESRRLAVTEKPKCVIVDVDGTVALNQGTRDYYDLTRVADDAPYEDVIGLVRDLSERFEIVIVSGREDKCRQDTELFLQAHGIPYSALFMRRTGDYRPDEIAKKEIYDIYVEPKWWAVYAVDDRPKICRLWRDLGITVLQVNDHVF